MLAFQKTYLAILASVLLGLFLAQGISAQTHSHRGSRRPISQVSHSGSVEHQLATTTSVLDTTSSILGTHDQSIAIGSVDEGCDSCGMQGNCVCSPFGHLLDWRRAELWAGVVGFSGGGNFLPTGNDSGQVEGNFGFQQGFNFGSRMPSLLGGQVGSQLGIRLTQSQLDGTSLGEDSRAQAFFTAGLFRRVDYGLQGGVVVDYLHDDWVYQADLVQLRGELSFLFSPCHDFGFRFSDSLQTDDTFATIRGAANPLAVQLEALDTYRFFYRFRLGEQARTTAELNLGFTDDAEAILGIEMVTPIQGEVGLQFGANYLMPSSEFDATTAYQQEAWNIGVSLVWTPGRLMGTQRDYYRPLFRVADNGSLISKRVN